MQEMYSIWSAEKFRIMIFCHNKIGVQNIEEALKILYFFDGPVCQNELMRSLSIDTSLTNDPTKIEKQEKKLSMRR